MNENDTSRKRFEVLAREVFKKFKACLTLDGINAYRQDYDTLDILYKSLQEDREKADITAILRQLHQVVDEAIAPLEEAVSGDAVSETGEVYDISQIDFDLFRREFARSKQQRTIVQNLKMAVEQRVAKLLAANPLRTDFQKHYETIVEAYNLEKDRATIEKTFQDLMVFQKKLDEESTRAMREGLDEETLTLFDILRKPDLDKKTIAQLKQVAGSLLAALKAEKLKIDHWRDKETTRDAVQIVIKNFLWNDQTGLPVEAYSEEDVEEKSEEVSSMSGWPILV